MFWKMNLSLLTEFCCLPFKLLQILLFKTFFLKYLYMPQLIRSCSYNDKLKIEEIIHELFPTAVVQNNGTG